MCTTKTPGDPRRSMNVVIRYQIFDFNESTEKPLAEGTHCVEGLLQRAIMYCIESGRVEDLALLDHFIARSFSQRRGK